MPISLIAAVARNGTIGREGRLPWRLAADLERFRRLTLGRVVLMGRRTWQSLGRPLPGRRNVVLTRDPSFAAPGGEIVRSIDAARELAADAELFVIGGAAVYAAMLPYADRLFITHVDAEVAGDAVFPPIDPRQWRLAEETIGAVDGANPLPHRFAIYERIAS